MMKVILVTATNVRRLLIFIILSGGLYLAFITDFFYLLLVLFLIIFFDILLRIVIRVRRGKTYIKDKPTRYENLYVVSHPYLPWVYRSNYIINNKQFLNYPLHYKKYTAAVTRTNSYGFIDGSEGNRDITEPKKMGEKRIVCIGASTTGNYIQSGETVYSYPSELEEILNNKGFDNVRVINCGVGGYNSAEILIRFALQIVDYEPDFIVIYHAYNDIRSYLTPNFRSDYSNSRRNLGELNWRLFLADVFPSFGLVFMDYLRKKILAGNIRNSLLNLVSKGTVDLSLDPSQGLNTYQRNLQSIIDIARSRKIKVLLSTYCHFLYPAIQNSEVHLKYQELVKLENKIMRNLAENNNLSIVDAENLFPYDEIYFVDSVHFTPEGMRKLAEIISPSLEKLLLKDNSKKDFVQLSDLDT
jgi:lysophospholipase L1-like esterase